MIIIEDTTKQLIRQAEKETNTHPTQAQIEAGNYRKGRVKINGFDIVIENPKGSYRKGVDRNGRAWKIKMNNTYGYFAQTKAIDGDAVDVFLGDNFDSDKIFCIDQYNGNSFDETKVMMGFDSLPEARKAYLSNYEKGWKGLKYITEVDIDAFRGWLYDGKKQRKAFALYKEHDKSAIKENKYQLKCYKTPWHYTTDINLSYGDKRYIVEYNNPYYINSNTPQLLVKLLRKERKDIYALEESSKHRGFDLFKEKTVKEHFIKSGYDIIIDDTGKKDLFFLTCEIKSEEYIVPPLNKDLFPTICFRESLNEEIQHINKQLHRYDNPLNIFEEHFYFAELSNKVKEYRKYQQQLYEGLIISYPQRKVVNMLKRTNLLNGVEIYYPDYDTTLDGRFIDTCHIQIISKNETEPDITKYLESCGYYLRHVIHRKRENDYSYRFLPKFDVDVSDYIYNNYQYLYHVTTKSNWHKIEKMGLCPKTKNKAGKHPESIYLSTNKNHVTQMFIDDNEMKNEIETEYVILSIDIKEKSRYKFFFDQKINNAVYTYDNIAPQFISLDEVFTTNKKQQVVENFSNKKMTLNNKEYNIVKEIGKGNDGTAYLLDNGKILKITYDRKEANAAKWLVGKDLEHIVHVYNFGVKENYYWYIMEYFPQIDSKDYNSTVNEIMEFINNKRYDKQFPLFFEKALETEEGQQQVYDYIKNCEELDHTTKEKYLDLYIQLCEAYNSIKDMDGGVLWDGISDNIGYDKNGILKVFDLKSQTKIAESLEYYHATDTNPESEEYTIEGMVKNYLNEMGMIHNVNLKENYKNSSLYKKFQEEQSFRYKIVDLLSKKGYIFHGTTKDFDSFDPSMIQGGFRGKEGYGAYFTKDAYKIEEYGNNFIIASTDHMNIVQDSVKLGDVTNTLPTYIQYRINIYNQQLNKVRNNRDYNNINSEIESEKEKLSKIFNNVSYSNYKTLKNNPILSEDTTINQFLSFAYNKLDGNGMKDASTILSNIGIDGYIIGNVYVIINFDKLNNNIVKDKENLMANILQKNDKLTEDLEYYHATDANPESDEYTIGMENNKEVTKNNVQEISIKDMVYDILFEKGLLREATAAEIYTKYYSNISRDEFNKEKPEPVQHTVPDSDDEIESLDEYNIYNMAVEEVKRRMPLLFTDGEGQKRDYDRHLKQLRKGKGKVDHQLQIMATENTDKEDSWTIRGMVESILLEDNKRLKDRVFQIPEDLYMELKNKYRQVKDNPAYTTTSNYKRLQNIIDRKGEITYKWMYTLVDWRDHYRGILGGEKQDVNAWLISADKLMKWVDETLKTATESIKQSDETASKTGAIAHVSTHFRTIK